MAEQVSLEHLGAVRDYVDQHSAITNRECRTATGVGYDTAIKIFGALCAMDILERTGETSGTKYVAPDLEKSNADRITVEHLAIVMDYVVKQGSVTSRRIREVTGLTCDTSIRILGALCSLGMLRKIGSRSPTQYVLAHPRKSRSSRPS